jgi:hypothetical protein
MPPVVNYEEILILIGTINIDKYMKGTSVDTWLLSDVYDVKSPGIYCCRVVCTEKYKQ